MEDHDNEGTMDLQSVSDPVEDEASLPPSIVPEDGGDPSDGKQRPKWLVPVIAAVVVVVRHQGRPGQGCEDRAVHGAQREGR